MCRDEPCSSGSPQANNRPQGDLRYPIGRRDLPPANCIRSECRTSAACPYSMSWGIQCRDEPCSSGSPQANNRPEGDLQCPVGRRDLPAADCIRAECRAAHPAGKSRPYRGIGRGCVGRAANGRPYGVGEGRRRAPRAGGGRKQTNVSRGTFCIYGYTPRIFAALSLHFRGTVV